MSTHEIPATDRDAAIDVVVGFLRICMPGKALRLDISESKKERTDQQNKALYAVAYPPIMEFAGLRGARDKDDLHTFFCGEYFGWVTSELFGRKKQHPLRTTTRNEDGKRDVLAWDQMSDFWSFVQQRAAEHGIFVPDPDPMWRIRGKIDAEIDEEIDREAKRV